MYSCLVSAFPLNQVWPGYQRPLHQTEKSSFVMFGSDEEVVLKIQTQKEYREVAIRPTARQIEKNTTAVKAQLSQFTDMNKGIIDLIPAAVEAIKQETMKKMELFDSVGKARMSQAFDKDAIIRSVVEEVLRTIGK